MKKTLCTFFATVILLTVFMTTGCFAAENLSSDDHIGASYPENIITESKLVTQTFENEADHLVHITVGGKEIVTTPSHPFYSPRMGWTDAVQLRAGDILVTVNGEFVVVEQVQHEILENPVKVYNFEVEDYHTYFVGENGLLVHNKCGGSAPKSQKTEVHHIVE